MNDPEIKKFNFNFFCFVPFSETVCEIIQFWNSASCFLRNNKASVLAVS